MYELTIQPINYYAVFGSMFGIAIIMQFEAVVKNAVTFVRGWRTF